MYGKKIVLVGWVSLFSVALMFSAMNACAQYTVGVEVGDWAGYGDISFEYASNVTGQEDPPEGMNMSWTDVEVLDVSGTNVTCRSTTIYTNGTEQIDIMWGDVATGEGNIGIGVIPSNLGPGDEIPANLTWFSEEPMRLTINGTVTRSYAGANREVNYVNITSPVVHENFTLGTQKLFFCWDKETGVICEESFSYVISYTIITTNYYMNMSMLWRMTATNMWPAVFTVHDGYAFNVTMMSNSTISNFNFNELLKQISFNVTGPTNKTGYCNVSVPDGLLWGEFTVYKDGLLLEEDVDYTETHNGTHYIFCINYDLSTHAIDIQGTEGIPEIPTWTSMLLILVLLTVAIAIYKRKLIKTQIQ